MKNNLVKLISSILLVTGSTVGIVFAENTSSETISGTDLVSVLDPAEVLLDETWNSDVNPTPAPEGAMNSPISSSRTIANFADYAVDFGYGKIQDHWAEGQIAVLYGYEGVAGIEVDGVLEFQSNRSITVTELASLILNNGNVDLDMSLSWKERTLNKARELNMITDAMLAKAGDPILREEMAYMLIEGGKSLGIIIGESVPYSGVISDLTQADEQFRQSIEEAYVLGLLAGAGDGYKPKNPTTRAETSAIINRLFSYTDRVNDLSETGNQNPVAPLPNEGLSTPNETDEEREVAPLPDDLYGTMTPNETSEDTPVALLNESSAGICIVNEDSYVILTGENYATPIILTDDSDEKNIFDDLKTGDIVEISHGAISESDPAQTSVYTCNILAQGSLEDISQDTLDSLKALGWEF